MGKLFKTAFAACIIVLFSALGDPIFPPGLPLPPPPPQTTALSLLGDPIFPPGLPLPPPPPPGSLG